MSSLAFSLIFLLSLIDFSTSTTSFSRRSFSSGTSTRKSICNYNANSRAGKLNIPSPKNATTFYTLPETILPIRYKLRLRIDRSKRRVYGHTLINVYIQNQTSLIEMNSLGLSINGASFKTKNVRVDARMVYNCPEKETIVLQFPKSLHRGHGNLTINFIGNLTEMLRAGLIRTQEGGKVVVSDFGPIDARRQFPCWDEPKFRAKFDLYLIVPRGYVALSNMASDRRREYSSELDEIRFATTPRIATFQLAAIYGPKLNVMRANQTKSFLSGKTKPVTIEVHSLAPTTDYVYALDTSVKLLRFYEYYFNQSYALSKLDLVAVNQFGQSSIEKLGIIFFAPSQLAIKDTDTTSEEELRTVAESVGHSLAHQWLGNTIVFQQWSQFWVCESLAIFMEREALDSLFPHWKSWERYAANEMRAGLQLDASRFARPLTDHIKHPRDIMQYFPNENIYRKSVCLLRMMKFAFGDEKFMKAIQLFIATHSNETAFTEDLMASFQAVADKSDTYEKEISEVIAKWTTLAGFPVLHVNEKQEGEVRTLRLRQERFVPLNRTTSNESKNVRDVWYLPINLIHSFNPFAISVKTIMTERAGEVSLNGIWEGEWVKLNPEFSNFYRVHYTQEMLAKFAVSVEEKLLAPLDRLNLIDDLFALIEAGYEPIDVGLRFLWSYENEDNPNVWVAVVAALEDMETFVSNTGNRTTMERYWRFGQDLLAKMYGKYGWYPDTSKPQVGQKMKLDEIAQEKVRESVLCLMGRFRETNFTREASKKYDDYIVGRSDLPVGLLKCVFRAFSTFASGKDNQTITQLIKFYKEFDDPETRNLISIGLGSAEQPKEIDEVIKFMLESIVKEVDGATILTELARNSLVGRQKVSQTIVQFFPRILEKFDSFSPFYETLKATIESFTSTKAVAELEALLNKQEKLRFLVESLRYSFEKVSLFEEWTYRDRTTMESFFEQAVPPLPEPLGLTMTAHPISIELDGFGEGIGEGIGEENVDFNFDFEDFDKRKKKKKRRKK